MALFRSGSGGKLRCRLSLVCRGQVSGRMPAEPCQHRKRPIASKALRQHHDHHPLAHDRIHGGRRTPSSARSASIPATLAKVPASVICIGVQTLSPTPVLACLHRVTPILKETAEPSLSNLQSASAHTTPGSGSDPCRSLESAIKLAERFIASVIKPARPRRPGGRRQPPPVRRPPRTAEQVAA